MGRDGRSDGEGHCLRNETLPSTKKATITLHLKERGGVGTQGCEKREGRGRKGRERESETAREQKREKGKREGEKSKHSPFCCTSLYKGGV